MSRLKRLITEIHHRSLWQVLLIYVGAGWACFELIEAALPFGVTFRPWAKEK